MNATKIQLLSILFLFILLSSSCDKENGEVAQFDYPFELEQNERIFFTESNSGLSLTLTSVQDSRCPTDVQCISAGRAKVQVLLSQNSGVSVSGELCIGFCDNQNNEVEDTLPLSLDNVKYVLNLKSVNPYPNKFSTNKNKRALFTLHKE